ncbi:MAG: bifunctional DNA primase/polymerase [Terracidiphilus sp.]
MLALGARGWRLLPVKPRGKLPSLKDWPALASSDPAALSRWTREFPACNWGVAMGTASGVFVIDVDGEAGRASLAHLERQGFTLPSTLTVTTGRADGGEHRYYRMPAGIDVRNDQSGKVGPHIDVRGTGGFVVCPPSTHASGKEYRFVDPDAPIADAPGWVIDRLTAPPEKAAATAGTVTGSVEKGARTKRLVSLAGTLHKRGMDPAAIEAALLAENAAKCSPPLPEAKVRAIARDVPVRYPNAPEAAKESGLRLVGLGDLLSRPAIPVDWIWEGRLAVGTMSICAAKPKVGKSTVGRNLALAVARGESFLGWACRRGAVLYLALEERLEDVAADFRTLGADGGEDIQLADAGAVLDLLALLMDKKPALLVIDPLFRLVNVRDEKAYAEVYAALGPLIDTARACRTHILALHHSSKLAKAEAIDAPIGSTALGGAVSTLLVMRRTENYRTLETVQRLGQDMPETVLRFDPATKRLMLGGSRERAEVEAVALQILAALGSACMSERELAKLVEGRTAHQRTALRELVGCGKVERIGTGKRGDPYRYSVSCLLVPTPIKKDGNKQPDVVRATQSKEKVVPLILDTPRNKQTRNENNPQSGEKATEKVVPNISGLSTVSEKDGNELFSPAEPLAPDAAGNPLPAALAALLEGEL